MNVDSTYSHYYSLTGDVQAAATLTLAAATASVKPAAGAGPYSVAQAAGLLGVSKETVYKLCNEGDLSHVRIGNRITITAQQLADYQEEQER